jgi:hypothetical protein
MCASPRHRRAEREREGFHRAALISCALPLARELPAVCDAGGTIWARRGAFSLVGGAVAHAPDDASAGSREAEEL